jgi:ATP/maltotriose-dependent transcriptional regulator MalT
MLAARERAARGDLDGAIPMLRTVVGNLLQEDQFGYAVSVFLTLSEVLLERATDGDVAEAQDVMDQLEQMPLSEDFAVRTIALLRMRALLARARGNDVSYREFVIRYRETAKELGFERHIDMANAM